MLQSSPTISEDEMIHDIIERWKELDWLPPLPNLDRHLEHILGGGMIVLIGMAFGADWFLAACIASCITFLIEFTTAVFVGNWSDSAFDFIQYQFHWPLYFASQQNWYLFGLTLGVLLFLYFKLLLARW
jgi:hypothetical protein